MTGGEIIARCISLEGKCADAVLLFTLHFRLKGHLNLTES